MRGQAVLLENGTPLLNRSGLLHPTVLFVLIWGGVGLLYFAHLSDLLIFRGGLLVQVLTIIVAPFMVVSLGVLGCSALLGRAFVATTKPRQVPFLSALEPRLAKLFRVWLILSLLEIAASGGVPIVWALQGSPKTYFDFGIPTIHGLLNSLIQALALARVTMYILTRRKVHLLVPAFVIVWSIIVMTRNMMVVVLLESTLVWLSFYKVRAMTVLRIACALVVLVLAFGLIGDARNANVDIRALAQPTDDLPEWMPSGVLWAYIYVTTPINNLINTMQTKAPLKDALFPNTTALLFPTVVRELIYGVTQDHFSGNLVVDQLNVSTAYTSPFQDYGVPGMLAYTIIIASVSAFAWRKEGLENVLIYAVFAQCLVLSMFFNHFFSLPIISQVLWIKLIFSRWKIRLGTLHIVTTNGGDSLGIRLPGRPFAAAPVSQPTS